MYAQCMNMVSIAKYTYSEVAATDTVTGSATVVVVVVFEAVMFVCICLVNLADSTWRRVTI